MRDLVEGAGYAVTDDPDRAEVAVVNTCAFIEAATEESIEAVLDLASEWKRPGRSLVVTGCMPSRYRDTLAPELPEVDAFLPVRREDDLPDVLATLVGRPEAVSVVAAARVGPSAYLTVCDGCDRACTYCTIPSIRGPFRSRTPAEVEDEARSLVAGGARELVLVGQDVSSYGRGTSFRLEDLVRSIAREAAPDWLRLMYVQPEGVTGELLAAMADTPSVCRYLDIPLQHASRDVLRAMGRTGDAGRYLDMLARVRDALPGVVLRTTFISGFPGETERDAALLEDFMAEAAIEYVGVFVYSPEEGTVAASLPDRVPVETARERAQALRDLADASAFDALGTLAGSTLDVLIEEEADDGLVGRWRGQAPEIDGVVYVEGRAPVGEIVRATIEESVAYDLIARIEP